MGRDREQGDRKNEKAKEDFSNVESGGSSTAPPPRRTDPIPPPRPGASFKTYVVQKGDSLSRIAKREYGDAGEWRKIFEANRDTIKDPDLIYPGQELKIPTV